MFDDDGMLMIDYVGWIDVLMLLNLMNYSYFNLNGCVGSDVCGYLLYIDVDVFFEVDDVLILIGMVDVMGMVFDFWYSVLFGVCFDWLYV